MFSIQVKNIFRVSIYFSLFVSIIFLFLGFINWGFISGWVIGATASIVGLVLNAYTAKAMLSRRRTKKLGRVLGFFRTMLHMVYYVAWIFFVLGMSAIAHKISLTKLELGFIIKPINFFTFIGGLSVVMISTVIAQIPLFNKKTKTKN